MSLLSRVMHALRPGRLERDLDDEAAFHIEARIESLVAEGRSRDEATREAARRFGRRLSVKEASLDVKRSVWLDAIVRDVRLGVRVLRKNAVVTTAAVCSLALALGACLSAFALVDALILRPLPVDRPDRLIYLTWSGGETESETFNDPTFRRLRDAGTDRVDLFAMSTQVRRAVTFDDGRGEKERVRTQFVSSLTFRLLGVGPARGRVFADDEGEQPGANPVAVLSHAFWTRRFNADPGIVGRWVALEERPLQFRQFQIVGVAAAAFAGVEPGRPTDLWLPYAMYDPRAFGNPSFNWFRIFGRLKDGVERGAVTDALQPAFTSLRREFPGSGPSGSPEAIRRFVEAPLFARSAVNGPSPLRRQFERPLWILGAIALLVLLIAGSNLANLFLARMAARDQEMALRLSIGAGRGRLIQQVLVESALVAAVACVLASLFAGVAAPAVIGMLTPPDDPVHLDLRFDVRLWAIGAGLTLAVTALFGVAPAVRASHVAPITSLKAGARAGVRAAVMRPFVAIQVAFSLAVLFVGSLLVLSFARLSSVPPGFATSDVLLLSVETVRRADPTEQRAALVRVLDRLRGVPGVEAASSAEFNVLGRPWTYNMPVPGREHQPIESSIAPVMPGFFETMRIAAVAGRTFTDGDTVPDAPGVIVVNETFARQYFAAERAVGRTINAGFGLPSDEAGGYEVVGVVRDLRYDLREAPTPTVYVLMPLRWNGTIHVRTAGDAAGVAARLREEVRSASPVFRVTTVTTQSAVLDQTLIRERLLAILSGFFSFVGLTLAAVGLYGVLSYAVEQRTREIGIRMALGSPRLGVVKTIVADAAVTTLVGALFGLGAGLYLSRFIEALLFDVRPLDAWSLGVPAALLFMAALLACTLPAWRAARVDPVVALRHE